MLHITNGTIYTMSMQGIIENGEVYIKGNKISAIGRRINNEFELLEGAIPDEKISQTIDAKGRCILPGFVDAHSHVGGLSVDGANDQDLNEMTNPVTAELSAYYAINPNSEAFNHILETGITTSCVAPGSANVIGGWVVVIKSAGESLDSRIIKNPVALKAAMGLNPKGCYGSKDKFPMSRMGIVKVLKEYFVKVRKYMADKAKYSPDDEKYPEYDLSLEHGIPVLNKEIPLKVHAYQQDMMTVINLAKEFDFNVTLDHALGASDFYDELEDPHVKGVIYGPVGSPLMPGELCKIDFECLPELDCRGIKTAVMTDGPITNPVIIVNEAGEAVRNGMDPVAALAMITINAAEILDCAHRVGSIEAGKDADILLYKGMPTEDAGAYNTMTLVDGEVVYCME